MEQVLRLLGDIVHNLQQERGCTAIFLDGRGKIFIKQCQHQRQSTQSSVESFMEVCNGMMAHDRLSQKDELMQNLVLKALKLVERYNAFASKYHGNKLLKLSSSYVIDYYAHHLIGPFLRVMVEISFSHDEYDPRYVGAYSHLLQLKEQVGMERALGARGLLESQFQNKAVLERLLFLLSEQESNQESIMALASPEQKSIFEQTTAHAVFNKVHDLHHQLRTLSHRKRIEMAPQLWFDLMTQKIECLYGCEKNFIALLKRKENKTAYKGMIEESYMDLIGKLPLFFKLENKSINALLEKAHIKTYPKNKMLFLEGEHANFLYIILKGWVKSVNYTLEGEEMIVEMLSVGSPIMETSIYLDTPLPANIQLIENATLLQIPTDVIKEQIQKDNDFCANMLKSISYHSQKLMYQIEALRLKNANERTRWFLLKLFLAQGGTSKSVELPYDKSLIASYMGMKRETFSRALTKLKSEGIQVRKNRVVIPTITALCDACDQGTAQKCKTYHAGMCHLSERRHWH